MQYIGLTLISFATIYGLWTLIQYIRRKKSVWNTFIRIWTSLLFVVIGSLFIYIDHHFL